jgi:hypothetical protein
MHRRQIPPVRRESAGVLFIVADRPEVEWEKVELRASLSSSLADRCAEGCR